MEFSQPRRTTHDKTVHACTNVVECERTRPLLCLAGHARPSLARLDPSLGSAPGIENLGSLLFVGFNVPRWQFDFPEAEP